MSRTVWGFVQADNQCVAVYYVQWTLNEISRHGANVDLIIGSWGEDADISDHRSVSLAYRIFESGPSLMVIDAATRPVSRSSMAGRLLSRDDVIGTHLAEAVFMMVDAVLIEDPRLKELTPG